MPWSLESSRERPRAALLALAAVVVLAALPLHAQDKPAEAQAPGAEEPAGREASVPDPAAGELAPKPVDEKTPSGFAIGSESEGFRLQVRGYVQFDGRFFAGDEAAVGVDTFVLRRVRPILQGTVGKYFEFNITPDFGGGTTVLQDAWLDVKYTPKARLRVGKFKSPVGLERLQPATAIGFVERAFPTALVPNRDLGIQVHGELLGGVVTYAVGLFDGAPDGGSVDGDLNDGKDWAGRLFLSPFKKTRSVFKDLGFGIAGTTGRQSGPLPGYRSGGQIGIVSFVQGAVADGQRQRLSPQLSFYSGAFGLIAEYARSRSRVRRADARPATFEGLAWQATATFALTGERASSAGLQPRRPFDPSQARWGAVELAARVSGFEIGDEAIDTGLVDANKSVRRAFAWAVGLNWWLTRNVKQVVDYERTRFTGGAAGGGDRSSESALFIRTQVSF